METLIACVVAIVVSLSLWPKFSQTHIKTQVPELLNDMSTELNKIVTTAPPKPKLVSCKLKSDIIQYPIFEGF